MAQDAVELGRIAVERLLERIAEPAKAPETTVLEAQVMPRGSMAAPRLALA